MVRSWRQTRLLLPADATDFRLRNVDVETRNHGCTGIAKQIFLGARETDTDIDYWRCSSH
jgi:hypothetical protein